MNSCRWDRTVGLKDSENLVTWDTLVYVRRNWIEKIPHTGHNLDLGNTVAVTEDNTDLRWGSALLCKLANLVDNL